MTSPTTTRSGARRPTETITAFLVVGLAACAAQPAPCEATSPAAPRGTAPEVTTTPPRATDEVSVDRAPRAPAASATPSADAVAAPPPPAPPTDPLATGTAVRGTVATPAGECTLHLNSIPASNVELDGRPLGATPRVGVVVAAGVAHQIVFRSSSAGVNTSTVTCKAGETRTVATRFGAPPPSPGLSDPFASPN